MSSLLDKEYSSVEESSLDALYPYKNVPYQWVRPRSLRSTIGGTVHELYTVVDSANFLTVVGIHPAEAPPPNNVGM
ncbi:Hypothetical predicted protein [Pelobates cultripes]|uniref:Uncharacterized protein n=1 Tax=Pelobates cultripes TaxID=61616 RepID=A0AAD1RVS5_PELCU|nr:Hypothetical predicted protein [Pelobates cultripes]